MLTSMYHLYCFALVMCASLVSTQDVYKTISLNKTLTFDDKELYGDFVYLNRSSTLQVNFTDVSENLSFIIFQAHSHLFDITMHTMENMDKKVTGMNRGLYSSTKKHLDTFYVYNFHEKVDLKLFITVHGYIESDPVPGGCNMEFPIPISPFMRSTTYNKTYIIVEAPPPQAITDQKCLQTEEALKTDFHMLYLPEKNYDADVYFNAIKNMTTLKNIQIYSRLIPKSYELYWDMRRMLSAYPGTGAIYVAISYIKTPTGFSSYSIYVPSHTYACLPPPLEEYDCELLDNPLSMFLSASLFFLGIFMCYFGHRFFKTQILTIGFLSGSVVTYILLSLLFNIEGPAIIIASAISGLCVGAVRVVCWWLYGIPVFVIVLSSADIGFLVASIFYYSLPVAVSYLQVDFNFWSLFISIMLIITMCLLSMSYIANLVCCAVIGAYAAIYPIDYYLGSNLKYILNNTIRRATMRDFNKAVIVPTFQWRDKFLCIVWFALSVTGFMYQYYYNKGRPPFPPPPRSVRVVPEDPAQPTVAVPSGSLRNTNSETGQARYSDERTPLLA